MQKQNNNKSFIIIGHKPVLYRLHRRHGLLPCEIPIVYIVDEYRGTAADVNAMQITTQKVTGGGAII